MLFISIISIFTTPPFTASPFTASTSPLLVFPATKVSSFLFFTISLVPLSFLNLSFCCSFLAFSMLVFFPFNLPYRVEFKNLMISIMSLPLRFYDKNHWQFQ